MSSFSIFSIAGKGNEQESLAPGAYKLGDVEARDFDKLESKSLGSYRSHRGRASSAPLPTMTDAVRLTAPARIQE